MEVLLSYLHRNFPDGSYHSVYEAGFSGFWAHHQLQGHGIDNIVVNPADVPTSQKETLCKTDSVDSRKLARSLRGGELTGIHIPNVETLEARTLLRARDSIVKDKWATILGYFFVAIDNSELLTPFPNRTNTVRERS